MKLPLSPEQQEWMAKLRGKSPQDTDKKKSKSKAVFRPTTEEEKSAISALKKVGTGGASWASRFILDLKPEEISEGQVYWLWFYFYTYRRQITLPQKEALLAKYFPSKPKP